MSTIIRKLGQEADTPLLTLVSKLKASPLVLQPETPAAFFHELRNPLNGMLGSTQLMEASLNNLLFRSQ
ncbi:MAG: hypothetical protein JSR33_06935 [Proteobacteria bacterium]|nr:hypothetical protein [Pseudomonadota bacterium]